MSAPGNHHGGQEFLRRLSGLQPDIGGSARVEMTDIPRASWRQCREIAEARGWVFRTLEYERASTYWILARSGTTPVARRDPDFVKGPGLAELRRYPEARAAAAEAMQELGVDPLSDVALAETRNHHLMLTRKATRRGAFAALSGMALLVLLLTSGRQLFGGGAAALVTAVASTLLLLGLVAGWVATIRTLRARTTAVQDFAKGYERVVSAVFKGL